MGNRFRVQVVITCLLAGLLGLFTIASPASFLGWNIYESFLSTIPFFAIPAIGMTLVVACGEMDMCFPSTMAVSGFAFAWMWSTSGSVALAVVLALVVGAAIGLINGLIVVKIGVPSIIATIGTQFFFRGLVMLLSGGLARDLSPVRETMAGQLFVGRLAGVMPAQALWAAAAAVLLFLLLNRHIFGDSIRFIGDNTETARTLGLPVDRTRIGVFALMGFLCGLAGVMACVEMRSWWPTQGEGYLLLVFASVFIGGTSVFGGTGSVYGTVIGALIIGTVEAGIISAGLSGFWTRTIYGVIIVASVSFQAVMARRRRPMRGQRQYLRE
jgi:simple sugar transport system permease protein